MHIFSDFNNSGYANKRHFISFICFKIQVSSNLISNKLLFGGFSFQRIKTDNRWVYSKKKWLQLAKQNLIADGKTTLQINQKKHAQKITYNLNLPQANVYTRCTFHRATHYLSVMSHNEFFYPFYSL